MSFIEIPLDRSRYSYQRLYMGSIELSTNLEFLTSHGIKHVISLDVWDHNARNKLAQFVHMWSMVFGDHVYTDPEQRKTIVQHVKAVAAQIHRSLLDPSGSTYVHCFAGVNRAPFCVAAFLMLYQGQSVENAVYLLTTLNHSVRRVDCLPNTSFRSMLTNEFTSAT